jgi:hypothetical protein
MFKREELVTLLVANQWLTQNDQSAFLRDKRGAYDCYIPDTLLDYVRTIANYQLNQDTEKPDKYLELLFSNSQNLL